MTERTITSPKTPQKPQPNVPKPAELTSPTAPKPKKLLDQVSEALLRFQVLPAATISTKAFCKKQFTAPPNSQK